MHPLHDYIAARLAARIAARRVVVWYDVRSEFAPFVEELQSAAIGVGPSTVKVSDIDAALIKYSGSMFEVRAAAEPLVDNEAPAPLVVYVAGVTHDTAGSVLTELEKAGDVYEPQLKRLARQLLLKRYTDGIVDELLSSDAVTYQDLARVASHEGDGPPSLLKGIFHGVADGLDVLAAWLATEALDEEIKAKDADGELIKLIASRVGLDLQAGDPISKIRSIVARYVLVSEFRGDLFGSPPSSLQSVPEPRTKPNAQAVTELARRLRVAHAADYSRLADQVESEFGLTAASIPGKELGSLDTFRFEERAVLAHCEELIAQGRYEEALGLAGQREDSFWLDRDVARRAQWEACRLMAELGRLAGEIRAAMATTSANAAAWIGAYTAPEGWHRLDRAQHRLEALIASLDQEPAERPLGLVRQAYDEACQAMGARFVGLFAQAGWTAQAVMHQTNVYGEVVSAQPKPVAYFLVDAMRYEMGAELIERLPGSEVTIRPAVAALPSITPVGMGALMPGASTSFDVVDEKGKLGTRIDGAFLSDLPARRKFMESRLPGMVDLELGELLSLSVSKLASRLQGAQVVVVRSQAIDLAGETGFAYQARQIMDTVIDNLARAIRKLAAAGVQHAVVSADHGHLFAHGDRDESMRVEAPGGATVDLHRRCWIGRGGSTPSGCIRVAATTLGYASDLDLVFPPGIGVFKAGGDLGFHHGGPTLQELIVPVITVRSTARVEKAEKTERLTVADLPSAVTNRIFSVNLQLGGSNLALFTSPTAVRPMLMAEGRQVGAVGIVTGAELDQATGLVTLDPDRPASVGFLLSDDSVGSLAIVVADPATDAELYRSPDIPVKLGV